MKNPILSYIALLFMLGCLIGAITYSILLWQFWNTSLAIECIGWMIVFGFSFIFLCIASVYKHHNNFKETIKN